MCSLYTLQVNKDIFSIMYISNLHFLEQYSTDVILWKFGGKQFENKNCWGKCNIVKL